MDQTTTDIIKTAAEVFGSVFAYQLATIKYVLLGFLAAGAIAGVVGFSVSYQQQKQIDKKIDVVEQRALDEPGRPQVAWDLARIKLESYLDRNLSQLRWILALTYLVMVAGFTLVLYGLILSFDPTRGVKVAIVGSASGVIVSFIGGSFLVIYKSILAQSKEYVAVLERINAVGMAVQVLSGIPDDQKELKYETTAQLAGDLIKLYGLPETKSSVMAKSAIVRRKKGG